MPIINCTFSSPFQSTDIDLGGLEEDNIVPFFLNYPWADWLNRMEGVKVEEIHFSPTLNFENKETKQKLLVSAVGDNGHIYYYVFYQRPKTISQIFGLRQKFKEDYTTEVLDQTKEQTASLLKAFVTGNTVFLEESIKF